MLQHPLILTLGTIAHLAIFAAISFHCLQRRRNASSTILWIAVAWSFPFLGPLLYISFGIDRVGDRGHLKLLANNQILESRKNTQNAAPRAYWHNLEEAPAANRFQEKFNRGMDALIPDHPALAGNRIEPLVDGDEAYPKMLAAIRSAREHIHLQSFIIGHDKVGREFVQALTEKAAEGVQIRLLYDRFGSTWAHLGGLFRTLEKFDCVRVAGWTQANPLKRQFQINLRNHRKCLVIDGKTVFFGGINIAANNKSRPAQPAIHDYHFRAQGPIVQEFQYAFLRDWFFITKEAPERLLTETHFPKTEPAGKTVMRLLNTGPSNSDEVAVEAVFNSIVLAKQQILAVTPYFVPPPEILRALRSAALRGVDVRLVVPAANNHVYVYYASRALYQEMLDAGVRIYERQKPFSHAKALLIDGKFSLVGTANLDMRSLHLNYETMTAVFSESFTDRMKEIVHSDISLSNEVRTAEWQNRPLRTRVFENFAALMSPVL
jgi:cardiolipin synthase